VPNPGAYKFFQIKGFTFETLTVSVINTLKGVINMKNKKMNTKTMEHVNETIQNSIRHKDYKENIRNNLQNIIKHLEELHEVMVLRDSLQAKVDTYTVDNLSYDIEDHRRDCKILHYLNNKIKNFKRIKTDYQYA
jgi:hypothetical protein